MLVHALVQIFDSAGAFVTASQTGDNSGEEAISQGGLYLVDPEGKCLSSILCFCCCYKINMSPTLQGLMTSNAAKVQSATHIMSCLHSNNSVWLTYKAAAKLHRACGAVYSAGPWVHCFSSSSPWLRWTANGLHLKNKLAAALPEHSLKFNELSG